MAMQNGAALAITTRVNIKYVGTLKEIDPQSNTVELVNVKMLGTEDRAEPGQKRLPASPIIYTSMVFNGRDIKDISIIKSRDSHQPPNDPAIVSAGAAVVPRERRPRAPPDTIFDGLGGDASAYSEYQQRERPSGRRQQQAGNDAYYANGYGYGGYGGGPAKGGKGGTWRKADGYEGYLSRRRRRGSDDIVDVRHKERSANPAANKGGKKGARKGGKEEGRSPARRGGNRYISHTGLEFATSDGRAGSLAEFDDEFDFAGAVTSQDVGDAAKAKASENANTAYNKSDSFFDQIGYDGNADASQRPKRHDVQARHDTDCETFGSQTVEDYERKNTGKGSKSGKGKGDKGGKDGGKGKGQKKGKGRH